MGVADIDRRSGFGGRRSVSNERLKNPSVAPRGRSGKSRPLLFDELFRFFASFDRDFAAVFQATHYIDHLLLSLLNGR
jgi:hypothetical protein